MPFTSNDLAFIRRRPTASFASLMVLAAGVYLALRAPATGLPPTGTVPLLRLENGSGAQVGICFDNGSCRFTGSLTVQGVKLSTGTTLTLTDGDARYVNQSSDTMTGTLTFGNARTAVGRAIVMSGSTVSASGSHVRTVTLVVRGTGSLVLTGTSVFGNYYAPFDARIKDVAVNTLVASTKLITVDVKRGGTTFFSTKPSIDANETSTRTGATPYVFNAANTNVTFEQQITVDVTGAPKNDGQGLTVLLYFDVTRFYCGSSISC